MQGGTTAMMRMSETTDTPMGDGGAARRTRYGAMPTVGAECKSDMRNARIDDRAGDAESTILLVGTARA